MKKEYFLLYFYYIVSYEYRNLINRIEYNKHLKSNKKSTLFNSYFLLTHIFLFQLIFIFIYFFFFSFCFSCFFSSSSHFVMIFKTLDFLSRHNIQLFVAYVPPSPPFFFCFCVGFLKKIFFLNQDKHFSVFDKNRNSQIISTMMRMRETIFPFKNPVELSLLIKQKQQQKKRRRR